MSAFIGEVLVRRFAFAFIRGFPTGVRRAAIVKREAFLATGIRSRAWIAIFEQTVANYGERALRIGSPVLYRKERL